MPFIHDSSYPDFTKERTPVGDWRGLDDDSSPREGLEEARAEFCEARLRFDAFLDSLAQKWSIESRDVFGDGRPTRDYTDEALVRNYVSELSENLELFTLRVWPNPDPDPEIVQAVQQNLPRRCVPRIKWGPYNPDLSRGSYVATPVPSTSYWKINDVYGTPYGNAVVVKFAAVHFGHPLRDGALVIVAKERQ